MKYNLLKHKLQIEAPTHIISISLLWVETGSTVPSLDKFTENEEDHRTPGEIICRSENLILNPRRNAIILRVVNKGDRPIQVFACLLHQAP